MNLESQLSHCCDNCCTTILATSDYRMTKNDCKLQTQTQNVIEVFCINDYIEVKNTISTHL